MMRKNKQRLTYLIIIICLFGLFLVFKNEVMNFFKPKTPFLFSKINQKDITSIEVNYNGQNTFLFIKNQNWLIKKDNQEYPADTEKANKIMQAVLSLKKEEIVANNKNKHLEMGIDKNKILAKTKDQTITVYIGKPAGTTASYVRINQENQVFLGNGITSELLSGDFQKAVENKQ
jgi:hypothetical protein